MSSIDLPILSSQPTESIIVPSSGKSITIRAYLVKEEKQLLLAAETRNQSKIFDAMCNVIVACVLEKDFKISQCTSFDLEYVFLMLRTLSVGSSAPVKVKCQDETCKGETEVIVELGSVSLVPEVFEKTKTIKVSSKISVVIGYPRIKMLDVNEKFFKEAAKEEGSSKLLYDMIDVSISKVISDDVLLEFHDYPREKRDEFVENLPSSVFAQISAFIQNAPKVVVATEFDCVLCKKHQKLELNGISDFF